MRRGIIGGFDGRRRRAGLARDATGTKKKYAQTCTERRVNTGGGTPGASAAVDVEAKGGYFALSGQMCTPGLSHRYGTIQIGINKRITVVNATHKFY